MSVSMYEASVPLLQRFTTNFAKICDKAAAHCREKGIAESTLLTGQLAPDMYPFTTQVLIVSTFAKNIPLMLSGAPTPPFAMVELPNFAAVQALLSEASAALAKVKPSDLDGSEDRAITIPAGDNQLKMKGLDYLRNYGIPNFLFHLSTGYGILRSNGVALGKGDYIGQMDYLL